MIRSHRGENGQTCAFFMPAIAPLVLRPCISRILDNLEVSQTISSSPTIKLTFYLAKHQDVSTLPSKSSWVQASPLSPSHFCLQLVDVRPQVLHDGQQEVERALLPFLPSTTRLPPPTPGSSLSRSSRRTNCSSFTSTVLASPALLYGLFG